MPLDRAVGGDEEGGRTVGHLAGQGCGDPPTGLQWRQSGEPLERGLRPRALVDTEPGQRGDLGVELACVRGRDSAAMTLDGEGFHPLASQPPPLGDELGAAELGDLLLAVAGRPVGATPRMGHAGLDPESGG